MHASKTNTRSRPFKFANAAAWLGISGALALGDVTAHAQSRPDCREASTPFVTMALRGGAYFAPYNGPPADGYFATFGIRNLTFPGEMAMESGGTIFYSRDEGCSWDTVYQLKLGEEWPLNIEAAPGGHAYAFKMNGSTLYALVNELPGMSAVPLRSPVSNIMGLGVDSTDPAHVRLAGKDGDLHESFDSGATWQKLGILPPPGRPANRVSFDPNDLDHVIFMTHIEGAYVSFDGGSSWTQSEGLSSSNGPRNAFNAVVSPIDSRLVWCMSLDLNEADNGHPSGGRHIYASLDGGLTFTPRVDNGPGITITNGPELTAHPTDLRKVAWVASNRFTGLDVYELNGFTREVKHHHNDNLGGRAVEYYLPNPKHMYIGLEPK